MQVQRVCHDTLPWLISFSLGPMSVSPETVGLKILAALKVEYEREPSLLKCRLFNDILTELANKHQFTQEEITPAVKYLLANHFINAVNKQEGRAALPSNEGLAFLSTHGAAEKQKSAWTMERRLTLYGIILAIVLAIGGLVAKYWPQ
jgi:hypothetical protein